MWWVCDSKTKYPLQGKLYAGRKKGVQREINKGENVMLQLLKPYAKNGPAIIADNILISLEGGKRLANLGLGFVGTIRFFKKCIRLEMRKSPSRPLAQQFDFFSPVYVAQINVNKPEKFYNKNKAGVDCTDQMVPHFKINRTTKRWTFAFFCNMLDIMALAAFAFVRKSMTIKKMTQDAIF